MEMQHTQDCLLTTPQAVIDYAMAGKAKITVVSRKTGDRLTFRLRRAQRGERGEGRCDKRPFFVSVLSGSDNQTSYSFLGSAWRVPTGTAISYKHSYLKSKVTRDAKSVRVIEWLFGRALHNDRCFEQVSVYRSNVCGRCGRELTDPESIVTGIGPKCRRILGL